MRMKHLEHSRYLTQGISMWLNGTTVAADVWGHLYSSLLWWTVETRSDWAL